MSAPDTGADTRAVTEVAVGLVLHPDGRILLAQRPPGKPYAGWWEFPGGKFEPGEDAHAALVRELAEELGITVQASRPWLIRSHAYPHAQVRLHFRWVTAWTGEVQGREGQTVRWFARDAVDCTPQLPVSVDVVRWFGLAPHYRITNAAEQGVAAFLDGLDSWLADRTLRPQLLLREPALEGAALERLYAGCHTRIAAAGGRLLVSSRHPPAWWQEADGVQLTARDLHAGAERPAGCDWVLASAHDAADLRQAADRGLDGVVLGPVQATESHPGGAVLGWAGFAALCAESGVPVYALGGLGPADLERAQACGALGVAGQRGFSR